MGQHLFREASTAMMVSAYGTNLDVRNAALISEVLAEEKPDFVVNLAAVTTVAESFQDTVKTYEIMFQGMLNLLNALQSTEFTGRVLFVSSSEVYGAVNSSELPVNEATLTRPLSPYAVAKISAEALCYQWSRNGDFEIVIARPFNHIGPGQSERFAISEFGRRIAEMSLGLKEPLLHVGDIDACRDFTDVRDIVSAYLMLLEHGENGQIYNVCSGRERSVRSLITTMAEQCQLDVRIDVDMQRFRLNEQKRICGDNRKLVAASGWRQKYEIEKTLRDVVIFWKDHLQSAHEIESREVNK